MGVLMHQTTPIENIPPVSPVSYSTFDIELDGGISILDIELDGELSILGIALDGGISILDIVLPFSLSTLDTDFFVASSSSGILFLFQLSSTTAEVVEKKAKAKRMEIEADSQDAIGFSSSVSISLVYHETIVDSLK